MLRPFLRSVREAVDQPNLPGLLGSTFALGMAFSFAAPFLSKWGTEAVGLTPSRFGLFMTATSLCAIALNTLFGRLSDTRFSRRGLLALGGIGGTLGFAGYGLLRDPWLLLLVGCTLHAAASTCFAQLFSHARETYRGRQAGPGNSSFTLSVVRVCFSFSWTVGPAVGSFMLIAFGFRGLFLAASGLYLIFLLGVLRFVPLRVSRSAASATTKPSLARTLRRPDLLICALAFATVFAASSINMMNLPLAVTRVLGGSERDFGIIFGIGPLVEIPLMLWFGHLASRGYQLPLIRLGFLVTLLYFAGLGFAAAPWHVYLLQILSGVSFAILTNVAIVFFQDLAPDQMGLATALFANSQAVGNLVGLLSFGFLVEAVGHRNSFLVCALATTAAFGLILLYRQPPSPCPRGGQGSP